ncbi:hypothetical protein NO758_01068 [Planktothrix agardhii]|nr:hypothetical protein NO758_01068 [Planktothrix agardhii]
MYGHFESNLNQQRDHQLSVVAEQSTVGVYPRHSPSIMETLEFIIYPDGRVQEKVTGIVGSSCAEVTAALEAELGIVLTQETTSEYYARTQQQSETATTQVGSSHW